MDAETNRIGAFLRPPLEGDRRGRTLSLDALLAARRALTDGRELAASVLAHEAGVAPSTASVHLPKLVDGGLVVVGERRGRHRYFRLATPEVARALEALARIAPVAPVRSLREGTKAHAVRAART